MKVGKILFIGGDPQIFPSVQIRCQDIASRLGCDRIFSIKKAEQVPAGYSAFICVKAGLQQEEVIKLSERGPVIWDIIDEAPPKHGISIYLTSTERAKRFFENYGRLEIIPHHHCNFSGIPNLPECRRPGWIGTKHWYPKMEGFEHDVYNVRQILACEIPDTYRRIGIGLNTRAARLQTHFHTEINTGIKLINCIGFGIPSISSDEPAYHEIGESCTIFTDLNDCAKWVQQLQNDDHLYQKIRENCFLNSSKFHISSILKRYESLISSL